MPGNNQGIVRVVNTGKEPFVDFFDSVEYVIPAGEERYVPTDASCLWLGYPGLRDDPTRNYYPRRDAYQRLLMRYGHTSTLGFPDTEDSGDLPSLECYTVDGERVFMLMDDPAGEHLREVASVDELTMLREQFAKQQEQLDAMKRLVESREAGETAEEVPEDKPRKVPVGARRGSA